MSARDDLWYAVVQSGRDWASNLDTWLLNPWSWADQNIADITLRSDGLRSSITSMLASPPWPIDAIGQWLFFVFWELTASPILGVTKLPFELIKRFCWRLWDYPTSHSLPYLWCVAAFQALADLLLIVYDYASRLGDEARGAIAVVADNVWATIGYHLGETERTIADRDTSLWPIYYQTRGGNYYALWPMFDSLADSVIRRAGVEAASAAGNLGATVDALGGSLAQLSANINAVRSDLDNRVAPAVSAALATAESALQMAQTANQVAGEIARDPTGWVADKIRDRLVDLLQGELERRW